MYLIDEGLTVIFSILCRRGTPGFHVIFLLQKLSVARDSYLYFPLFNYNGVGGVLFSVTQHII